MANGDESLNIINQLTGPFQDGWVIFFDEDGEENGFKTSDPSWF